MEHFCCATCATIWRVVCGKCAIFVYDRPYYTPVAIMVLYERRTVKGSCCNVPSVFGQYGTRGEAAGSTSYQSLHSLLAALLRASNDRGQLPLAYYGIACTGILFCLERSGTLPRHGPSRLRICPYEELKSTDWALTCISSAQMCRSPGQLIGSRQQPLQHSRL
ncbi:hypothetical protein HDV63DRAFT_114033 [Trichoderma sp. SZMC 28014]